jgi:hypothetical protein
MWQKKGLIYSCDLLGTGYAQDPFIDVIDEKVWRIYFSSRTKDVISLPFYMDVEAGNPSNILKICKEPLFMPGYPGTFDDTGITMTSIVTVRNVKYIYYCGWNRKTTVPYSLSIGLAIAHGDTFIKKFDGPVMDRSPYDPICVSAPFVIREELDLFRMWFISFTSWEMYNGRLEPTFVIKTAYSCDGINWTAVSKPCFKSSYPGESFARPWVISDGNIYKMWYSVRGPEGYREKTGQHYMIGYAESNNGENFKRMPIDITTSETGWDSEMMEYASVLKHDGYYYMLYNGNEFGKTGFGYAMKKI